MVTMYTVGTTILVIPSGMAAEAKQDAWIGAVIGVAIGLLLVLLYNAASGIYPGNTLVETIEAVLGKWIGKAISFLLICFAMILASELLYYIGNFITTQILPETPILAVHLLFAIVSAAGVRYGVEVLARSIELLFPLFILLLLILLTFSSFQIEPNNLLPIMEADAKSLLRAGLFFASTFSLTPILLLMIYPASVDDPHSARKAFLWGTAAAGVLMIGVILLSISVLGADMTARQIFPSYALAKKINVGNFLQRIEIVVAGMWFISIFVRMTIYYYAAVTAIAQTFKLKDYRFLVLPACIILVTLSLIVHPDIVHSMKYDREVWPSYAAVFGFLLPLLLVVVHAFRSGGRTDGDGDEQAGTS